MLGILIHQRRCHIKGRPDEKPFETNREVLEETSNLKTRKKLEESEVIHKQTEEALLESEAKYRAIGKYSMTAVVAARWRNCFECICECNGTKKQ